MTACERAFAIGAISGMQGDYATFRQLAATMGRAQSNISQLRKRVVAKTKGLEVGLWDEGFLSQLQLEAMRRAVG